MFHTKVVWLEKDQITFDRIDINLKKNNFFKVNIK